jgi:hypothetical protein
MIQDGESSKSGSGSSVGQVSISRGEQPVNNQQSSEAEHDQLTQVCELEIENISSTVFILRGSAGARSCFKSGPWYWWTRGVFTSQNFSSGEHHPHLGPHLCTVLYNCNLLLIYNTVHITDYFQFIFSMLPPDFFKSSN